MINPYACSEKCSGTKNPVSMYTEFQFIKLITYYKTVPEELLHRM